MLIFKYLINYIWYYRNFKEYNIKKMTTHATKGKEKLKF